MASTFPTSLDTIPDAPTTEKLGESAPKHSEMHNLLRDAIAALEATVGTDAAAKLARLLGVLGGQTLIGGTAATDALTLQGTSGDGTATADAVNINVGNNGETRAVRVRNDERISVGSAVAPGVGNMLIDWETYKGFGNEAGQSGWDANIRTGGVRSLSSTEKRPAVHNAWTLQPSDNTALWQISYLNELLVPETNTYNFTGLDSFGTIDLTAIKGSGSSNQFHNYTSEVAYHSSANATFIEGIAGRVIHYGSGTLTGANSLFGLSECRAAGTITSAWGTEGVVRARAGTITNAIGVGAKIGSYTGALVTNAYGVNIGGPQESWTSSGSITNCYALYIGSGTNVGTNKWSIYNQSPAVAYFAGSLALGVTAASAKVHAISTTEQLRLGYDAPNYLSSTTDSTGKTTFTAVGTAPNLKWLMSDATTNAIYDLVTFSKNSSGAGAAGLGVRVNLAAKSSTTADTLVGAIDASWVDATHASRKGRVKISAYDTAIRECIRAEASGTAPMLGFYGVTAVVRPTALTAQLTTLTYTAPTVADYAIQNLTSTGGFGFVTADEGNSVLAVIKNLQDRVAQLETKLQSLGLLT